MPSREQNDLGIWGEEIAGRWLSARGYSIVGRRVRAGRHGELDLIARKNGVLSFVEVKTRSTEKYGRPAAAVNAKKKRNLCRAAAAFLRLSGYPRCVYRFDVIEVVGAPGEGEPLVRHIIDAFGFGKNFRSPACGRAPSTGKPPAAAIAQAAKRFAKRICSLFARHSG